MRKGTKKPRPTAPERKKPYLPPADPQEPLLYNVYLSDRAGTNVTPVLEGVTWGEAVARFPVFHGAKGGPPPLPAHNPKPMLVRVEDGVKVLAEWLPMLGQIRSALFSMDDGLWRIPKFTERDWFAYAALTGLAAREFAHDAIPELAYRIADGMLRARDATPTSRSEEQEGPALENPFLQSR